MIMKFLMDRLWIGEVTIVLLGTLVLIYGIDLVYRYFSPRLSSTRIVSNKVLFYALYRPLQILLLVMGIYFSMHMMHTHVAMPHIVEILPTLKNIALLSIVIWFFLRLVNMAESVLIVNRSRQAEGLARLDLIFKIIRVGIMTAGALVLLPMLHINISGLLALGGVGGILAGVMAKDVLTNTVGGLMVYIDQPFSRGDRIRLPDRNIEGIVEQIGWRLTVIRLFNQQLMYLPNAVFMTIPVENFSRMKKRRISLQVDVIYKEPAQIAVITEKLMPDLEMALHKISGIESAQPILINATGFEASACHLLIKLFVKKTETAELQDIQQDILLKIFNTVAHHGLECVSLVQK